MKVTIKMFNYLKLLFDYNSPNMYSMALIIGAGIYSTDLWGQEAEKMLTQLAGSGPWYLQVAFTAPRYKNWALEPPGGIYSSHVQKNC
jgi:hypothetical protein